MIPEALKPPLSSYHRFVIALHLPVAVVETGLLPRDITLQG